MKWLLLHPFVTIILMNLLGLSLLEVVTRVFAYHDLIPLKHYPTSNERLFMDDINPHFGVWRYPNRSVRHTGACFDVEYRSNSQGMRDAEVQFESAGEKRVVVLGDSFVEGFGVEERDRLTEVAEEKSGIEMLNFGISGSFSSTQEFLLYENLAAKFEHSAVALFFLPSNDFQDNDPEYFPPDRYRPYLRNVNGKGYEVYYPVSFEDREQGRPMSPYRSFRREIYNRIYLINALRQLGDLFESSELKDMVTDPFLSSTKTSYDDYSEEDLNKLVWGYTRIAKQANPRPVHIFIIPREVDFISLEEIGTHHGVLARQLEESLADFKNVSVHDLLPFFQKKMEQRDIEHDQLFHPCDGHWSVTGHSIAAEALLEAVL